jgi:hypothetical protein
MYAEVGYMYKRVAEAESAFITKIVECVKKKTV